MRVGGLVSVEVDGEVQAARGNWTIGGLGDKRESVIGADGYHGYTEKPQPKFIEGSFTDRADLNLTKICAMTNGTVRAQLSNGKSYTLSKAFYAGAAELETEEGDFKVRFEGAVIEEVQ